MRRLLFGLFLILLIIDVINVVGQPITDPSGDFLDKTGKPATGEQYLDIIEANLGVADNNYVGTIKLAGDIPVKTSSSSIFIEWDFMIDADKNPSTAPWGAFPLLVNDIGVDYMVRLCLLDNNRWGQTFDGPKNSFHDITSQVAGNEIKLPFSPSDIGGSTNFDFTILVRKYGERGAPNALLAFDKAPEKGHYTFQEGAVTIQTTGYGELPIISMKFTHATVYYNQGNDERAKDIGEAFEYAYEYLQKDFPETPTQSFKIHVYRTQEDLVQGLIRYSGFSAAAAKFFESSGAPRPIGYVMHVSPQFNWHTVAHELTHTFIEKYSGRAFMNIKWLDEGLAEYEAWKCVSANPLHSQEEESFKSNALYTVNQLKNRDMIYPLSKLTTDEQWTREMSAGNSLNIYSQAYLVVSHLVSSYGMDKVKSILKEVQNGAPSSEAVKTVLGKTQSDILDEFKETLAAPTPTPTPLPTTICASCNTTLTPTATPTSTSAPSPTPTREETTRATATQAMPLQNLTGITPIVGIIVVVIIILAAVLMLRRKK